MATSYGTIKPTFYRDFAKNKTLNHGIGPNIEFVRNSNATYFDNNGQINLVTGNIPRFDSDLNSLIKTTNYVKYSNDFSQSYWENYWLKPDIQKTEIDPFGNKSGAWKFFVSGCNGSPTSNYGGYKLPERGLTGLIAYNTKVVTSIWAKCDANTVANTLGITLAVADGQAGTDIRSAISTGWQRFSVTGTYISGTNGGFNTSRGLQLVVQRPNTMTDSGSAIYIYGAQVEISPYLTNHVLTTGIPVTATQRQANSLGLLVEESRTNLLTYSQDISNSIWGKTQSYYVVNNTNGAPDGGISQIIYNTGNGTLYLYRPADAGYTNPSGTIYALSCYVKSDGDYFSNAGISQASFGTINKQYVGNGWYRHWFTGSTNIVNGIVSPQIRVQQNEYVEVWGFQTEVGNFPSSYIPTTSSNVTRNSEVVGLQNRSTTSPDFSGAINQYNGTLTCTVGVSNLNPTNNQGNNFISIGINGDNYYSSQIRGQGNIAFPFRILSIPGGDIQSSVIPSYGNIIKLAYAYSPSLLAAGCSGIIVSNNNNSLSFPQYPTYIGIGSFDTSVSNSYASSFANNCISSIAYYPYAMSTNQLQILTTV